MAKKWLLEGRDVSSSEDFVKKIQPCKLPLMCNVDLDSIAASEQPADAAFVAKYQKLIGELLYLSVNTMPEIGFVMSCLTRYMSKPTQKLGEYAKQVVRYAWGRRDAKLTLFASKSKAPLRPGDIGSFADSSWADEKPHRKSTNCHYILLNNALVHWRSKIASILATSTTEAELISVSLAKSGHFKGRSKHFEIRFRFISDYVDRGLLELRRVDSKDQLADLGTAPRPWLQLQRMRPTLYGEV